MSYQDIIQSLLAQADIKCNGERPWDLKVHNPQFYKRFLKDGRLGLGESYMDGWWDCEALDEMFFRLFRSDSKLQMQTLNWKFWLSHFLAKIMPDGSTTRSRNVGEKHYDLGNDLFSAMLDKNMVYTCGIWDGVDTLDAAQEAKLDMICKRLKLKPGMRLLDVGCGWGGLCKYAVENYGVTAVGISVSQEQLAIARERCAGLPIEFRFQDYREVTEKFDRITSIEMFEHVGPKYFKAFFEKMRDCLKDEDSIMILQTSGINITGYTNLWLTRYIFPGGYLPSLAEMHKAMEHIFYVEDTCQLGAHYYPTFMTWHHNFVKGWESIAHNYDQRFFRMWSYFLLSCAAGFRSRRAQVWQLVMTPKGLVGGYDQSGFKPTFAKAQ